MDDMKKKKVKINPYKIMTIPYYQWQRLYELNNNLNQTK